MNITNIDSNKRAYTVPAVDIIKLDNEISLALESNPPDTAPGEGGGTQNRMPDGFNNNPYNTLA